MTQRLANDPLSLETEQQDEGGEQGAERDRPKRAERSAHGIISPGAQEDALPKLRDDHWHDDVEHHGEAQRAPTHDDSWALFRAYVEQHAATRSLQKTWAYSTAKEGKTC